MADKVIPLEDLREQRDYEQLFSDLREFVETKVSAGEPIVVIIERDVSFWERVKEGLNV